MDNHVLGRELQRPAVALSDGPPVDEIGLYELWQVLRRRRWLILAVVVLIGALGALYAFISPTRYDYRTSIALGYVYLGEQAEDSRRRYIGSIEAAEARLNDLIIPRLRQQAERELPRVSVEARASEQALLLRSRVSPERQNEVASLHADIADALAADQRPRYEQELSLVLGQLQVQEQVLEDELSGIREQMELVEAREHAAGAQAALMALIDAQRAADLRREASDKRASLAQLRATQAAVEAASQPSRASFIASRSEDASSPGRMLLVTLSLGLGVFLGLLAALFAEFSGRARPGAG